MDSLAEANTNFTVDLFKKMEEEQSNNIFFSPLSISAALAMVYYGAKGNTAAEMRKVLHFDKITESRMSANLPAQCDKPGGPHNQFKELLSAINQPSKNYTLSIANRLYGSDVYEFLQQYIRCIKELYHAELERVDFMNALEEVRKKINSWVESQTNGKIKDLLPVDSLDQSTVLILVNAIYFKGKWMRQFNPKDTHEADFWTSKEHSKKVQMMAQKDKCNYAKITNPPMEVLELQYDKGDLSMIILLPDKNGTTKEIVRQLTYEKFQEWTSSTSMQNTEIWIFLPKFKVEEKYLLSPILSKMGMKDMFNSHKADLSGISGRRDLLVSQVLHKAYIEVNEEGTEAAAATGVVVVPVSAQIIPEFKADHPFLLFIRHNATRSILFAGKVFSP
ncbi:serpin B3-like [Pantherophis guttatus]|uniref:Serpin B7 n=1 Tax=Pantherophis guttatus TaxID=94885 RepID=A0A6P9AZ48_PANGU|nr:serpin B3-like [Pantherophis guttatus]XP_034264255.1 serpin B3-like [Pantherophis guttatus]